MKSTYLDEANELLTKIESSLLLLETSPNDDDLIEEVFRSMHTLKGSSAMFGYENISNFVHNIESIYDLIREGKLSVSKPLLNDSLASLDHLKNIVNDTELEDETNKKTHFELNAKMLAFLGEEAPKAAPTKLEKPKQDETQDTELSNSTYYVRFEPNQSIFNNGTNPLYILDELHELGHCEIFPRFQSIENIDLFDPTKCYAYWEILLSTKASHNDILDVFVFVESDSKIAVEQLCAFNFLAHADAKKIISELSKFEDESDMDLNTLKEQIAAIKQEEKATENSEKTPVSNTSQVAESVSKAKAKSQEKAISSIRVSSDKLDALMSIVSELVTTQAGLSLYAENHFQAELEVISENVEKLTRQLRDIAFGMTLIPIKTIMSRFQRLVRDVSNDLNKAVDFNIEGDETELDKNIIESITDPLMHILRNSLDHGIESKEDRLAKGKPEKGTINFKAYYSGAYVHIDIADDGKGIDVEAIKAKAKSKGIIAADANLSDKEAFDLIFAPGFSTAAKVTDVSGRGVGMDVVRRNIESLRGEVEINSTFGKGTTLTIKLPLTLSIIDGLLVKIDATHYVVPLSVVDKCYEIESSKLQNNFDSIVILDEAQIPFINLRKEFLMSKNTPEAVQIIVVNNGERKVGLTVDGIIGEYQAVLKPIGRYYRKQEYISGATILGDGTIALVFDTNKIINQFAQTVTA